jgi:hypothetical protein
MREPITRQAAAPTNFESRAAVPAVAPAVAPSPAYGSARNPLPLDLFKAKEPFVDPATQLQRDRLTLDQAKFADAQQRYADQQAAAAQRIQNQQQQATQGRQPANTLPGTPVKSGGGGNPAMNSNIKDGIKTPPKQTAAPAKRGGGGGGGRGGGGGLSPEQKARNKAREGRQTEREKDRDRKMADWNNTPEQRARKAKNASDYYSIRDADKPKSKNNSADTSSKSKSKPSNNSPGGDPSYGPGTGGDNDSTGDAAAAAAMFNHLNSLNPQDPTGVGGGGNKSAGVTYKPRWFGPAIGFRSVAVA